MATEQELKNKYQPVVRWTKFFNAGREKVLTELAEDVPLLRMAAHCYVESRGIPTAKSGPNTDDCPNPGVDCAPDKRAHGLFQIWWPPFGGVDWSKIEDAEYNSYLGAKTLGWRHRECKDWDQASVAFFGGGCHAVICDPNTGVCADEYLTLIHQAMQELSSIGYPGNAGNPQNPDGTNGGTSTPGETPPNETCFDVPKVGRVCVPIPDIPSVDSTGLLVQSLLAQLQTNLPRVIFVLVALVIIGIGLARVL